MSNSIVSAQASRFPLRAGTNNWRLLAHIIIAFSSLAIVLATSVKGFSQVIRPTHWRQAESSMSAW